MMKFKLLKTSLAVLFSLTSFTAMAEIVTSNAYVRAVPPGSENTAVFVTVTNKNQGDVYLTNAEGTVSKAVELHNHVMKDGAMMMRPVDQIKVGAAQSVNLEPGGYHIMLINLNRDLKVGENVELTLSFSNGNKVNISAPVKKIMAGMHSHHHH